MFIALGLVLLSATNAGLLVSTSDVGGVDNALLLDARTAGAYAEGHVPGALHLDVNSLSEKRGDVTGLLKPLDQVRKMLGDAGVDPGKRIVVYSAMDQPGDLSSAARMFWVLEYVGYENVAVLDGGMAKWTSEGRKTEQGPPAVKPIALPDMKTRGDRLATAANVDLFIRDQNGTLVDSRSPEYFRGEKKADVVKEAGHIPGAVNLPVDSCVGADSGLKSWEELQSIAMSSGVDKKSPIITYCNTGRSASAGYLVLRLLGYDTVAMYDGSMSEWTASGAHPVEKAEKK